jgi:hypothetical protein
MLAGRSGREGARIELGKVLAGEEEFNALWTRRTPDLAHSLRSVLLVDSFPATRLR